MLTILVGMSGSGKDAIQKELVNPENGYDFERLVTATTRPMREGEQDGVDYHFMSSDDFKKGIENNQFIEYRSYDTLVGGKPDTWYYGSLKQELDPEKDYCIILDVQGAKDFVEHYGRENCFVVEVSVADEVREQRAMARGSFDKSEWNRRLVDDRVKFSQKQTESVVNYTIGNNFDVEYTVCDLLEAFVSYSAHEREPNKLYKVFAEQSNYSYYEPLEITYKIFDTDELEEIKKLREKEREMEIETSLQMYFDEAFANTKALPENCNVGFVSLEHSNENDNRLFKAMVNIEIGDESAAFMVVPFPENKVLVYSMGLDDAELVAGQPSPLNNILDDYESVIIGVLEKGSKMWMENYFLYDYLCYSQLDDLFEEYQVRFSPDEPFKRLTDLTNEELYRLSAELSSIRVVDVVDVPFTDEQKQYLGEDFNPFYNSEISVVIDSDTSTPLMLVELTTDESKQLVQYCNYEMSDGYVPEKLKNSEKEKKKQFEMEK